MNTRHEVPVYSMPYQLARDAGLPPPEDVLIIGAGSGNDVSVALAQQVKHVDAVEIDPHIVELGRKHHPERPYDDPRVQLSVTDGRGFLRHTTRKYDLIIYALVDSLSLHSSYATVRLESFLFTAEAMADVREHLKPGGVFVAYNFYREGWVVTRLAAMAEAAFGAEPLVLSPEATTIRDTDQMPDMAVLLAGATERIRQHLDQLGGAYRVPGGETGAPYPMMRRAEIARAAPTRVPSDDWPFFYLREPRVPKHNLVGIALVLGLSLGLLAVITRQPLSGITSYPHLFWLGAGFMLIETKSVTRMAVLFGSTWLVNSVVFAAVLVMILLANLFVSALRPQRVWPYFVGLLLALATAFAVPLEQLLGVGRTLQNVLSCAITFAPIFFASIVFAIYFRDVPDADIAMGSNIAGVVLGGVLEYLSLVIGYEWLLAVAAGLYTLAWIGGRQPNAAPGARPPGVEI
jgi:spermidine synthase